MNLKLALPAAFLLGMLVTYSMFSLIAPAPPQEGAQLWGTASFEQKRGNLLNQLSVLIDGAIQDGKYHCCIEPACTMCYLEGNAWNDGEAGRCDCVDFIVQGKDPCPQCIKAMKEGTCRSEAEVCPSL